MPELPEVETVCRGLAKALPGHRISKVQQNRADLRIPFPAELKTIAGKKILSIARRAKYVLVHLDNKQTLLIHLGMSGSLKIHDDKYTAEKHDHMVLTLDNGTVISFNDPRRFGLVELTDTKTLGSHKFFKHLGPEPLEKEFSADYLHAKLNNKKLAIKLAIMDQRVVVGVGNIYAAEALFDAGIHPERAAHTLSAGTLKKLVTSIQKTLKAAIKAGGSSLRDYVQTDGELGYFQHKWTVYGKAGEKCRGCSCNFAKTGGIQKMTQGGRSTFYCPEKQS